MGKGVGVVFPYGESTLSLYIICKQQPLYNNLGVGMIVFYGFVGSTACCAKLYHNIPGISEAG